MNYEHQQKTKLENIDPAHRTVERVPGVGSCIAWEINEHSQGVSSHFSDTLLRQVSEGKRAMYNVEFTDEDGPKGMFFNVTPTANEGRELQIVHYNRKNDDEIVLADYGDTETLGLRRMQQGELTHRFMAWLDGVRIGETMQLPHSRVEFATHPEPVTIDKLDVAVGVEDSRTDASADEQYTFARLQAAILERLDIESAVTSANTPEQVARRGLFRSLFRRR